MPGRSLNADKARFTYNGMEEEPEISSGHQTTFYRELDTRLGRWWSIDPIFKANWSTYNSMSNNPTLRIDPDGDTDFYDYYGKYIGRDGNDNGMSRIALSTESAEDIRQKLKAQTPNAPVIIKTSEYRDLAIVPTVQEMEVMSNMIKNTEKKFVENGMIAVINKEGNRIAPIEKEGKVNEINMGEATEGISKRGEGILYEVHSHTFNVEVKEGNVYIGGSAKSSPLDIARVKAFNKLGLNNPFAVIGYSTPKSIDALQESIGGTDALNKAKKMLEHQFRYLKEHGEVELNFTMGKVMLEDILFLNFKEL